ncbi:MAG: hypothetical protein D6743_02045 [Calditrichaeota bacterium]|nr:MAG: hypothetical protein D6743_02045 [Calditrichota bacterium]
MNKRVALEISCLWLTVFVIMGRVDEGFAQQAVIVMDGVKLYSLPMVEDSPVAVLARGDTVRVIGQRGGWVKVEFAEGQKGWMRLQVPRKRAPHHSRSKRQNNGLAGNGVAKTKAPVGSARPDRIRKKPKPRPDLSDGSYRRFGYSFGMGFVESDFSYNWKFVFQSTRRLALEGSFKHVLGSAADSYFIMANWTYLLDEKKELLPYLTAGLGVINTVPDRSIDADAVSNMAINYGIGVRKHFKRNMSFTLTATQFTAFVGKGTKNFREFRFGFLVGKFWD